MPNTRRRLNLNTCTVDQLEFVDGVTRPLAKRIVAYRNRAGHFKTISELGKVRGVGDHMMSLISKHVYVLPSSPRRSRRSSLASSRTNLPQRGRAWRSTSRVSFNSSRHSPTPIHHKSPKRNVVPPTPTRRSERVLSRLSFSRRSSISSPSIRSSHRHTSSNRQAKQTRSAKKNSKSKFRSGPVYVDSAQNVSIDLGKLAKEGCNLTLHGGASDGQLCPFLTINVKELDGHGPSVGLSIPSPDLAITERQRSSSPERPTQASSVVGENVREVMVIRDARRTTETFPEDPSIIDELPVPNKSTGPLLKRRSLQKVKSQRDRSGDYRKRSRSRSRSRSLSPKKGSPRRSRSGSRSRQHSPSRSRRRHESPVNDRLSRSDIENWLQEGSAPHRIDRGGVNIPISSSTPRRRRDKRERRSPSPITRRQDVAGPSRIEDDGRNTPIVLDRSSRKQDRHSSFQDGRRSRRDEREQSGRWQKNRDSGSPRRKVELDDDDANLRGRRRYVTKDIEHHGMNARNRSRSRGRRSSERQDEDDDDVEFEEEQVRRHRPRDRDHSSKADRDRRRRHEETDLYAIRSWCSVA